MSVMLNFLLLKNELKSSVHQGAIFGPLASQLLGVDDSKMGISLVSPHPF
jgi:hypothetical protein